MNVSVVITCWNGRKLLEKNLPLVIEAAKNPKNKIKEILVVDDFSTDDSVLYLKENFKEVKVFVQPRNFGYAETCNLGVIKAKNELVTILNLDVIPDRDFLEEVLPHFADRKIFAVSFNEGKFGPGKLIWKDGFLEINPTALPKKNCPTDWVSGGSGIFRRDYWIKLGGMDRLFLPFYFEDVDLGIRASKMGFKNIFEPKAKVDHQHEATINKDNFRQRYINDIKQRNHLLLTWRNINSFNRFSSHFFNLGKRCLQRPGYVKIFFMAAFRLLSFKFNVKKEK